MAKPMVSRLRSSLFCRRPSFCISPTRKVHPSFPSRGSSSTSSRRTTNWGLDENVAGTQQSVTPLCEVVQRNLLLRHTHGCSVNLGDCGSRQQWSRPSISLQTGSGSSGPRLCSWECLGSSYRSPAWRTAWWRLNRTSWGEGRISQQRMCRFSRINFTFPSLSLNSCFGDIGDYDYQSTLQHQQHI